MPDDTTISDQPTGVTPAMPSEDTPVGQNEPAPQGEVPVSISNESEVESAPGADAPLTEEPVAVTPSSPPTEVVTPPLTGGDAPSLSESDPTIPSSVVPPLAPAAPAPLMGQSPHVNLKSLWIKAMETIRFRKQAKLEKIMEHVRVKGSITNDQAQKLLRVSDATASRYLLSLTQQGRLRKVGKTSASRYEPTVGSNGGN
ncbi:MAG: hypothetical protein AB1352_01345 [Patescibacteria group bacterium]